MMNGTFQSGKSYVIKASGNLISTQTYIRMNASTCQLKVSATWYNILTLYPTASYVFLFFKEDSSKVFTNSDFLIEAVE